MSQKTYHLGDPVQVLVSEVDITTKSIDFILVSK